jgi:hypothetical protein
MDNKICSQCKIEKSKSEYYVRAKNNIIASACKECARKKLAIYRKNNPEKIKSVNRASYLKKREQRILDSKRWKENNMDKFIISKNKWKERNPDRSRVNILRKHGLSIEQYEEMLNKNNNSCWICSTYFIKKSDAKIDHCHDTGKVRGILCNHCNASLGFAKDNIDNLHRMIKYLKHEL